MFGPEQEIEEELHCKTHPRNRNEEDEVLAKMQEQTPWQTYGISNLDVQTHFLAKMLGEAVLESKQTWSQGQVCFQSLLCHLLALHLGRSFDLSI